MKTIFALLVLATVTACQPKTDTDKQAAPAAPVAAAPAAASAVDATAAKLPPGHAPIGALPAGMEDIKVPKASGPDARTVAEVITKSADLKNKTVVVRGKVVKFNAGILKMNWIHLRDGTGSDADSTNDLLVTTQEVAKVGDVVVVKGVVHVDKDFGMGYSYKVLVEEAKLQK